MPTMRPADMLNLRSGDYPYAENVGTVFGRQRFCEHDCFSHIEDIAWDMSVRGYHGPPVCIIDGAVRNGLHRIFAAYLEGIPEVPFTDVWADSEDSV